MISESERQQYIEVLADTGSHVKAAHIIGCTLKDVSDTRKESVVFDQMCVDASIAATDALEQEARRRAVDGVVDSVFHQGEVVGTKRTYSDSLLKDLLKANNPQKFRERVDVNHSGEVNVIIKGFGGMKRNETEVSNG